MSNIRKYTAGIGIATAMALVSGCSMMQPSGQAAAPVAYNPPSNALGQTPTNQIAWYHVSFDTGSRAIAQGQRQSIHDAATSLQGTTALTATVIGRTDGVGSDASNMRLSEQRADAVRDALIKYGHVDASRIETRWTGDRQQGQQLAGGTPDGGARMVDIAVH